MLLPEHVDKYLHPIDSSIKIDLSSKKLNNPFSYMPDELSLKAVNHLQQHLINQQSWKHDFGLHEESEDSMGKMFGVLVVEASDGEIGYLAAFSGKLAGQVNLPGFVPPIFNMLEEDGFYRKAERKLNDLNYKIKLAEEHPDITDLKKRLKETKKASEHKIHEAKEEYKRLKTERKNHRDLLLHYGSESEKSFEINRLNNESRDSHRKYKDTVAICHLEVGNLELQLNQKQEEIIELKRIRKSLSSSNQDKLFEQYSFLNTELKSENLGSIFIEKLGIKPPSGAGDCTAPKLFQFSFKNQLKPLSIAEFWWGKSPSSEVRIHQNFYPACKGKCEPILNHMLKGIELMPSVKSIRVIEPDLLETIFEDDDILIINKPDNLLSVPGKIKAESVYSILRKKYPNADGPLVVHRLDMATSGIMVIAKSLHSYKILQEQFISRTIKKTYKAFLEGPIVGDSGTIDLPMRVDHYDRPRQVIDFENGKQAITYWKVIQRTSEGTLIEFSPHTGRTHQLRVHSAHHLGLNCPIKGDDIYGKISDRLYLHAEILHLKHPATGIAMTFNSICPF
ncbi:MAG: pseudouridine synthase [Bacteroidia bacterium]